MLVFAILESGYMTMFDIDIREIRTYTYAFGNYFVNLAY